MIDAPRAEGLRMLALRKTATGTGNVSLVEVPRPEPRAGEVRIAVFAAGICGTDLHIFHGEYPASAPVTMGHEIAGTVDAVGAGVDEAWLGARVAPEPPIGCGDCEWCREGVPMSCPTRRSLGSGVDGGFASQVLAPARSLHRLPAGISDYAAALVEPLACVCNALADPPLIAPGDRVVITGAGPIGILAAQVARAAGGLVTLMGTTADQGRLAVAAGLGIDTGSVDDPADRARIDAEAVGRGIHAVVECAGAEAAVRWGLTLARPRGRYVQVGVLGGPVTVPFGEILLRDLTVTSGFGSTPASWRRAVALLQANLVALDPLVTSVLPLRDWQTGIEHMERRVGLKTVFDPRLP